MYHLLKRRGPASRRHPLTAANRARPRFEELEARTLLSAYPPIQVRHAYGFDQVNVANLVNASNEGAGQTIAIVDAYYDPGIQKDLAGFSRQFGLPQLDGKSGDGTFTQVDLSNK